MTSTKLRFGILAFAAISALFFGCLEKRVFQCADGSVVDTLAGCPTIAPTATAEAPAPSPTPSAAASPSDSMVRVGSQLPPATPSPAPTAKPAILVQDFKVVYAGVGRAYFSWHTTAYSDSKISWWALSEGKVLEKTSADLNYDHYMDTSGGTTLMKNTTYRAIATSCTNTPQRDCASAETEFFVPNWS